MVYLARRSGSQMCGLQEIAEHENIPSAYLGKILGDLRKHQLLRSVKGIHGGYELSQPADSITLWDIYQILDPLIDFDQCILGLAHCQDDCPCTLHDTWMPLRKGFFNMLQTKTIGEVASKG